MEGSRLSFFLIRMEISSRCDFEEDVQLFLDHHYQKDSNEGTPPPEVREEGIIGDRFCTCWR